MSMELEKLEAAISDFELADDDSVDPRRLSSVVDRLQAKLGKVLHRGRQRGDWQLARLTPASWAARTCGLSRSAAADRLCVGNHLDSLPEVRSALTKGEIGYQAASSICHLHQRLGERWPAALESDLVGYARHLTVERFRFVCRHAHHEIDPDGFDKLAAEDFERRWLEIHTLLDGMHSVDGILDPITGAAFKTALESLARHRGPEDNRNQGQRMADALSELLDHHLNEGRLPRRKGVRPHITLTTTLPALKDEVGTPAAELEPGIPISNQTVERLACDCTMSRVLLADSQVVDVGRATRTIQPATRRALNKRDRGCRWPGCDRAVSWSTPHHIEFWSRGGKTNLANLVLLCHFHHQLVHEEGWKVAKVANELHFIPPVHLRTMFVRGPDVILAA
jgi:Domain of unknown function (DUF222)/HNH endonuclease